MSQRPATFGGRLSAAGATTLSDPRLLWGLVALFAVRRLIAEIPVFMPAGADVFAFIAAGRQTLAHPDAIYPEAAAQISQGFVFVTLYPPPQLLIAAVYALMPDPYGADLWMVTNVLASLVALLLLRAQLRPLHPAAEPAFWLILICFTPLFEDIRLGQRGGLIMLLSVGAMRLVATRPALAGVLGGVATSLKFYPAALVMGADPRRHRTFIAGLVGSAVAVLAASFIPFKDPALYVTRVLVPSITWQRSGPHDCFQNSTQLLFARVVGGEQYGVIDQAGVWRQATFVPWHFTTMAAVLGYATIAAVAGATVWAAWRSGYAQPYSLALCFSLGTLVPGEVFTYQFLPMLPLLIITFIKALERRKIGTMVALAAALWVLLVSPCALPLPSLWTVAALAIFAISVFHAPLFRAAPAVDRKV